MVSTQNLICCRVSKIGNVFLQVPSIQKAYVRAKSAKFHPMFLPKNPSWLFYSTISSFLLQRDRKGSICHIILTNFNIL